jgi:ribosomal protein L7/L12
MTMTKVVVVLVLLVIAAVVLGTMLRRRNRGELFVIENTGRLPGTDAYKPGLESDVVALLRADKKIQAIKLVREHTGMGLKESKDAVEDVERTGRLNVSGRPSVPGRPAAAPPLTDADFVGRVRQLKSQRRAIEAIKLIRERTGMGLAQAKQMYDNL